MAKPEKGLLYKTTFIMRFFDADWNELKGMVVETANVDVLAIHLHRWRQSQIDRLLANVDLLETFPLACVACVEVTCG